MRRCLPLLIGILIGQWLTFSGLESPAEIYSLAHEAGARGDWMEAARHWSHAVALQPDNAYFNYMRAASLARLGHRHAAADALQMTLMFEPSEVLARQIRHELASLSLGGGGQSSGESLVTLEAARGVWVIPVTVNDRHRGRFLFDTGSSVVVLSPEFAEKVGVKARANDTLELETLGGRTRGAWATVASLRVGGAEVRNTDVIIHSPGGEIDGILGNTFLSRWDVSFDPDRRILRLRLRLRHLQPIDDMGDARRIPQAPSLQARSESAPSASADGPSASPRTR
jgi:clan AA aspartic protease (TIGR02281 family)